jgi:hypothetical protein
VTVAGDATIGRNFKSAKLADIQPGDHDGRGRSDHRADRV